MKVEYINPFIQSTQNIMETYFHHKLKLCKIFIKNKPFHFEEMTIAVNIVGKLTGSVLFTMSEQCGTNIASYMIQQEKKVLDEMALSALSELTNMISGHAATSLSTSDFIIDISSPKIFFQNKDHPLDIIENSETLVCIPLAFEDGNILEMDIALKDNK